MIKWEYRQEIFQGVELLNEWGAEGWEIAGFFGKDGAFMVLKRQVRGRAVVPAGDPAPARSGASGSASAGGGGGGSRSSSGSSRSSSGSRSGGSGGAAAGKGKFKEMI